MVWFCCIQLESRFENVDHAGLLWGLVGDLLKLMLFFFFFFNLIVIERMSYGGFKIFMYSLMMKIIYLFILFSFLSFFFCKLCRTKLLI